MKKRAWVLKGALFFPFPFLVLMFFKTNIQVLPLGKENTVKVLKNVL